MQAILIFVIGMLGFQGRTSVSIVIIIGDVWTNLNSKKDMRDADMDMRAFAATSQKINKQIKTAERPFF